MYELVGSRAAVSAAECAKVGISKPRPQFRSPWSRARAFEAALVIRGGKPTYLGRGFLKMALGFVAGPDDELGYDFKSSLEHLWRGLLGL